MKKYYVCFFTIFLVFLFCSYMQIDRGAAHKVKIFKSDYFSLEVPSNWKVVKLGRDGMYFGESEQNNFGGAFRQEFNVNFSAGEKELPSKDALLRWMLPNHTEVTKNQRLKGFFTETYLIHLISSEPAAQGGKNTGEWTYIIFVDKNKSTLTKFVAYEIFFNTKNVSESNALKIAKSFKIK